MPMIIRRPKKVEKRLIVYVVKHSGGKVEKEMSLKQALEYLKWYSIVIAILALIVRYYFMEFVRYFERL